jgi:hypothetical protein
VKQKGKEKMLPKLSLSQLWQLQSADRLPVDVKVVKNAICPICNNDAEARFDDPDGIGVICNDCKGKNLWPFALGRNLKITGRSKDKMTIEFELLVDDAWYKGSSNVENPFAVIATTEKPVAVALNNKILTQMAQATTKH